MRLLILKMQEPILTILCMHPTSLMRTVDISLALSQDNLMFIGAVRRLTSHGELETCRNAPGRTHNPIPAIALIELGALACTVLCTIAIKHDNRLSNSLRTV